MTLCVQTIVEPLYKVTPVTRTPTRIVQRYIERKLHKTTPETIIPLL